MRGWPTTTQWALFRQMADPQGPPFDGTEEEAEALLAIARGHRILPLVHRRLNGSIRVPSGDRMTDLVTLNAISMQLELLAAGIGAAIAREGLPAVVVKGEVFARRLYPFPSDRPFTDIDILAEHGSEARLAEVLAALGYRRRPPKRIDHSAAYREQKWSHPDMPGILVELHGDLVHYPRLRRSVTFDHAALLRAGGGDPEAPLALFAVAVVHAALGHKFHEMRLLVDVLQAFRLLSEEERTRLPDLARALAIALEVTLSLQLVAALFGLPEAARVAEATALPVRSKLARGLVTPDAVLTAPLRGAHGSRLRRHAFRWVQYAGRAGGRAAAS